MAKGRIKNNTNSYEEARKQRLEDNKKRFQDLGISKISKSLSEIIKPEKKSPVKNQIRYRSKMNLEMLEPRRSSRARNPVVSYHEEAANIDLPHFRRRFRSSSSTSYIARPLDEVKVATYAQRVYAKKQAEVLQSNLQSEHPSFVKSMLRSHVYSCFWLGLPSDFCREHLPSNEVKMVLENENGLEYEAVYIGSRVGLSGGWRAFALDHKLDDGDALVFELTEPNRFRVYIVRAYVEDDRMMEANGLEVIKAREDRIAKSKKGKKIQRNAEPKEPVEMSETSDESIPGKQKGGSAKKAKNCKKVTFSKKLVKVMNNDSDSSDHSIEEDYEEEETTDMITSTKLQTEEVSTKLFRRSSRLTKNRM